jgi:hypothetical protein
MELPASGSEVEPMISAAAPRAITMWDFSWLERRYPGGGYEDWDRALDELVERGYDAVRIEAFPHLSAVDPHGKWTLRPYGDQADWGAPFEVEIQVEPALHEFIAKCAERSVAVALSSWYRADRDEIFKRRLSPEGLAEMWLGVLRRIGDAGLLDSIIYVDLCNEFPLGFCPWFFGPDRPRPQSRTSGEVAAWMKAAADAVRAEHPSLPVTFSFTSELDTWRQQDVSGLDFLELHIWMSNAGISDFEAQIGYDLTKSDFDPEPHRIMVERGEAHYRSDPGHWLVKLDAAIDSAAEWSRATGKPLVTTEGWSVIVYRDAGGGSWGWLKEICEHAVRRAASTGRWAALCTSGTCGPQFQGMWGDVEWHRRLTDLIRGGVVAPVHAPSDSD